MIQGTVRTMAQVGAVNAVITLGHGLNVLSYTGVVFIALAEMYIMWRMCLLISLHVGMRFAGLC